MASDKMKELAERMKKGAAIQQEKPQVQVEKPQVQVETVEVQVEKPQVQEKESNEEPKKAAVKRKYKTKNDSLESMLSEVKEREYNNNERVYIDSNLSQTLKLLKLATGIPIGTLANVMIEKMLSENELFIKSKLKTILGNELD